MKTRTQTEARNQAHGLNFTGIAIAIFLTLLFTMIIVNVFAHGIPSI